MFTLHTRTIERERERERERETERERERSLYHPCTGQFSVAVGIFQ